MLQKRLRDLFIMYMLPHLAKLLIPCVSAFIFSLGCTQNFRPGPDTLVVALEAQPLTLDPRFATDAAGIRISGLIFNAFVRVGDHFQVLPDAAERWQVHGRKYTFYLKPDLKFHNGRAVTIEDILFSWEFYRGPSSPFASSLKSIKAITAQLDGSRIKCDILLEHLSDSFLLSELPSVKILPKKEVLAAGDDFNQILIGTGPFKFDKQILTEIRLSSAGAKIDHLVFKVIRDDFTRYQKMLKGEVDIAQNVLPTEKIAEFQKRPNDFDVLTYPGLNMTYILLNFRDPLLSQKDIRAALAHAVDRESILKFKMNGLASTATSILSPANFYYNSQIKNPAFDPERARQILKRLKLDNAKLVLKTANNPAVIDTGRVFANQLKTAGFDVKHESYEWATYYDDIKKGNFQLAIMKWVGIVDPDIYRDAFHSKETPPGRNRGGYNNSALDKLLDQGMVEESREKRREIFNQVQKIVHEDLAIIPLWYDRQVAVARREVLDYVPIMTSDYWPFTKVTKRR